MSVGPITATPQLRTAYDLADLLRADLAERNVPVVVEVDVWSPEVMRGAPRVTIEMGDGTIGEPKGAHVPGAWHPVNVLAASQPSIAFSLDAASTIAPTLSGAATLNGTASIAFSPGGTLGTDGIAYAVSYDGGATFGPAAQLGADVSIALHGLAVNLGSAGALVTDGDTITVSLRGSTYDVAAPVLDNEQAYTLSIHAPAPSDAANVNTARAANVATVLLLEAVSAAVRRGVAGPLRAVIKTTWPKVIDGYPAFVHGSMAKASLVLANPIYGDSVTRGQGVQMSISPAVDYGNGAVQVV